MSAAVSMGYFPIAREGMRLKSNRNLDYATIERANLLDGWLMIRFEHCTPASASPFKLGVLCIIVLLSCYHDWPSSRLGELHFTESSF